MYELRAKDNNDLVNWSEYPDEIRWMQLHSIYDDTYIVFNPNSCFAD